MSFSSSAAKRAAANSETAKANKEHELALNKQLADFVLNRILGGNADKLADAMHQLIGRHSGDSTPCFVTWTGIAEDGTPNPPRDGEGKDAIDHRRLFELSTESHGDRAPADINDVYFAGVDDEGDLKPVDKDNTRAALHFARGMLGFNNPKDGLTPIQAYNKHLGGSCAIDLINLRLHDMDRDDDAESDDPLQDVVVVPHKARGAISLRLVWDVDAYKDFAIEELAKGVRRKKEWEERNRASRKRAADHKKRGFRG